MGYNSGGVRSHGRSSMQLRLVWQRGRPLHWSAVALSGLSWLGRPPGRYCKLGRTLWIQAVFKLAVARPCAESGRCLYAAHTGSGINPLDSEPRRPVQKSAGTVCVANRPHRNLLRPAGDACPRGRYHGLLGVAGNFLCTYWPAQRARACFCRQRARCISGWPGLRACCAVRDSSCATATFPENNGQVRENGAMHPDQATSVGSAPAPTDQTRGP